MLAPRRPGPVGHALTALVAFALLTACQMPGRPGLGAGPPSAAPPTSAPVAPSEPVEPIAPTVDLAAAGDEFNDPARLAKWTIVDGAAGAGAAGDRARYDISTTTSGALTVVAGKASWVGRSRGFFLFKQVEGDFSVTVRVRATGRHGLLPTVDWSLTGLLVRAPAGQPRTENWVGHTVGFVGQPTIERKTTRGNRSILRLAPVAPGWIELRTVRVDRLVVLLYRRPGQEWVVEAAYSRPDLPRTVQVGINAGTGYESDPADLTSTVDWIRFAPIGISTRARAEVLGAVSTTVRIEDAYAVSAGDLAHIRRAWGAALTADVTAMG
jgi:hypothetical protein